MIKDTMVIVYPSTFAKNKINYRVYTQYYPFHLYESCKSYFNKEFENLLIHVWKGAHVICILVPELSRTNPNALANILSNDTLNHEFVTLILTHDLHGCFTIVSNLFRPCTDLLWIKGRVLNLVSDYLLDNFFRLIWSEFIFENGLRMHNCCLMKTCFQISILIHKLWGTLI